MKIIVAFIASFAISQAAIAATSWLKNIPSNWPQGVQPIQLPQGSYVEVPVSMLQAAENELRSNSAVKEPAYVAKNYHLQNFTCPNDGAQLYLVRALYENGSTGGFWLYRVGNSLWVSHQSLGAPTGMHRSALLVCLRFSPEHVYVTTGGGM